MCRYKDLGYAGCALKIRDPVSTERSGCAGCVLKTRDPLTPDRSGYTGGALKLKSSDPVSPEGPAYVDPALYAEYPGARRASSSFWSASSGRMAGALTFSAALLAEGAGDAE